MLATLPLDMIENGQRLRGISEAQVEALVNSIGDVGLLNPITVYRRKLLRGGEWVDGYGLVAGLHRKTACERLGLVEIEANVLDLSDLECQIAECDENLCAPQLSPADRARFTARRKDAYLALHPETREHVAGGKGNATAENFAAVPSFAADTAAKTGVDERTVRLHAERGEKVEPAALDALRGTELDTGAYLDKLKHVPVSEQLKKVRADLSERRQPRRIIRVADAPLDDEDAKERQVAALMSAWNKASAEARQEFMERIDVPVLDRSAA